MSTSAAVSLPNPQTSIIPHQIGDLPSYTDHVSPHTPGKAVARILEQNPKLPGILIAAEPKHGHSRLIGMVSRQKCFEQLGRPFGVEVFLNRPIVALYKHLQLPALVLPADMRIEQAVETALHRPADQRYEPIVVEVTASDHRLLDLHVLLTAESDLLTAANDVIHHQFREIQTLNQELEDKVNERTQALQEAYQQLAQLDQNKTDFISVASAELRSPLMVVSQYNKTLLLSPTIQTNSGLVRMITEMSMALQRLEDVVGTMLDVARVDHQELALNVQEVAIEPILAQLQRDYDKVLRARELTLSIQYAAIPMPKIRGDAEALYKIFNHLLQNAIKFTPNSGYIAIRGRVVRFEGPGLDGVEVVVQDTGLGIAPEQHELVFSKFYQTGKVSLHNSKLNFKGGGAGLGLAIVRGLVEAHGGRVWVESPGFDEETFPGSSFYVRLPIAGQNHDMHTMPLLPAEAMQVA
ncbi:MAG: ATP-binding protein [Chloroflexota bacterium]